MITEELIMKFLQNPWISFILAIFSIISFMLEIFPKFLNKKRKSLNIEIKSNNIFTNFESIIENVKVTCENKNISTLTITKILMWCNGKETIYDTDITKKMPLLIKTREDVDILEAKVIFSNNQANNVNLEKLENNNYKINFEFLDKKNGFIIQVVHTGRYSDDIIVDGKIKGIAKNIGNNFPQKKGILDKIFEYKFTLTFLNIFVVFFISSLFIFSLGYFLMYIYYLFFRREELNIVIHLGGISSLIIAYITFDTLSLIFRIPKDFKDF